jgi:SAM-dependent methyltransferase
MNEAAATEAARHLARVVVADLETADLVQEFGAASFDVVVFGDVLEHLRDPLTVLRQARPLLRPGGYVVISTPNIAHGDVRLALLAGRFNYTKVGILDDTHLRFFTRDSLVQFLHDSGFVLAELRRSIAELFTTELGVQESDADPALVASLRGDIEARTYQFVVTAVPEDAASVQSEQALRVDVLATERDRLAAELSESRRQLDEAVRELAALRDRLATVQAAHDTAVSQRDLAYLRIAEQNGRLTTALRRAVHRARARRQ